MVNTVVTFENDRISPSMTPPLVKTISTEAHAVLSRRLYLALGTLLLIVILIPTGLSIGKDRDDFAYHLLFVVHSSFLLLFLIATAIYRNLGDGITAVSTLLLLAVYKTIHYLIQSRYCQTSSQQRFLLTTAQLTVIYIFVITYVIWTCALVRRKSREKLANRFVQHQTRRKRIFFAFLNLNLLLTISSLILHIRQRDTFDRPEVILLSVGIPCALLWYLLGMLMSIYNNCLSISSFYFMSILQPLHLIHLLVRVTHELHDVPIVSESIGLFSLLIISFVCIGTNFLVHLLTSVAGCWMVSPTDRPIANTRWISILLMSLTGEPDPNESLNLDEIEQLLSDEPPSSSDHAHIETQSRITVQSSRSVNAQFETQRPCASSSSTRDIQHVCLSLEKSRTSSQDHSDSSSQNKSRISVLSTKTSSVPGPVGLLPILKTTEDLKRLKDDRSARDTLMTSEEKSNVKRTKTSADLFSLNINNYPSYDMALQQLQDSFGCEPISIHTALVKARLGIKKRIPLMCAAVTHYDRQENTILLDKTAHIRATFIGDDELLDNYNIRVGHTLILRNVAVFTATRHRHHYVNIYLPNIIAIQDPLNDSFSMPSTSQDKHAPKPILCSIDNELSAYGDATTTFNETFQIFSQSDDNENDQISAKKPTGTAKGSNNAAFNHIEVKSLPNSANNRFRQTIDPKAQSACQPPVQPVAQRQVTSNPPLAKPIPVAAPMTPPSSVDLLQMVEKPIGADLNTEAMKDLASNIDNDDFFTTW